MKYSARLVTALAAVALLVVAILALGRASPVQAGHGPTHVDGKIYLTNKWSTLTTESPAPSGRTTIASGKSLYSTFNEVTTSATGTVVNEIQTNSNVVVIDVVDADKNIAVATSSIFTFPAAQTATGTSVSFPLPDFAPIIDRNADGSLNASDVTVIAIGNNTGSGGNSTSTVFVSGVLPAAGSNGGVITLTANSAISASATTTLGWSTSEVNTITGRVKVTTTQDTTGIWLDVVETARNTGRFRAEVTLFDAETTLASSTSSPVASSGQIKIQNGGQLSAVYYDDTFASPATATTTSTAIAVAESSAPTGSVTSPAHNAATTDQTPALSGSVSDTTSGLDKDSVFIYIDKDSDTNNGTAVGIGAGDSDQNTPTLGSGAADGDTNITLTFTPASNLPTGKVDWQIKASDMAGNIGYSDSDGDPADNLSGVCPAGTGTACAPGEGVPSGRGAPHVVVIDVTAPVLVNSFTGHYWDTTKSPAALGQNRATSIEVVFDSDVDPASVTITDFEVGTQVPTAVDVFSAAPDSVFLTLAAALKADDKPVVKVVGQVSDKAGNTSVAGALSKAAIDSLGPTLGVTLSGGSSVANPSTVTNDKMTITITSDEAIAGDPTVQIWILVGTATTTESAAIPAINQGSNTWIATFTKSGRVDGKKSVVVVATDTASAANRVTSAGTTAVAPNASTKGNVDSGNSAAITFTLDTTAPVVGLSATSTTSQITDERQPFIALTFSEAVVTINKTTLDAVDIIATLSASSDKKQFIHKPTADLTVSDHKIIVQATDDAGNKSAETTLTLTVTERKAFELPLKPGWNLVSLRSEPADTSINSVITVKDISTVITYDPTVTGGPWLVATRGTDGLLSGSLTTIDGLHGYWINTTSFEPIKVLDPKPIGGSLPPAIPVSAGWNLVPARDLSGTLTAGKVIASSATYFNGTKIQRAYKFDTLTGAFVQLVLTGTTPTDIKVGEAYWAYFTEAGAVVP